MSRVYRNPISDLAGKVRRNLWRVEEWAQRSSLTATGFAYGVHFLNGMPSRGLRVVGITGTNGKTTTTYLLHQSLSRLGEPCGLLSTVTVDTGLRRQDAWCTTPTCLDLAWLFSEMVRAGRTACAMEVSSHGLQEHRVKAVRFALAVFTNLTHDHLDFHGSMEAYAAAKARLFSGLVPGAAAVLNRDDPWWEFMARDTRADVLTFGSRPSRSPGRTGGAAITYEIVENSINGLRLRMDGLERRFLLCGGFNAQNLAAAYAGLRALGFQQGESLGALAESTGAPGRIEILRPPEGEGPFAVVDYAHNPDGLEATLKSVRQLLPAGGRLFLVFGCGGNRDKAKRPVMGELASRLADEVVLTDDNPRWEDPERILGEIRGGMSRPPLRVERDREAAIRFALETAGTRDIVLVAGKGHERYQQVGSQRSHFDDREVVGKLLEVLPRGEGDAPAP